VSSVYVGVDRLQKLLDKYGWDVVQESSRMLLDYSERRIREGLKGIPDGTYEGEDYIDDDGVIDTPIKIHVRIEKRGDHVVVDLQDSAPQAQGNTNSTLANTYAAIYYVMIGVVDPHVPPNSGCYRPIEIRTRPGTIVHPVLPAAVASRTNASQKIVEAMLRALSRVLPDRVMAGSHGQISTCGFGGFHPDSEERFIYTDIQGGGAGARPYRDGRDGQDSHLPRFMNTPVEAVEHEFPIRIERYEFIPDSGGAGKFRGGLATRRDIRVLVDEISFARYGDRQKFSPFGLFGGKEGSKGSFILNPGTEREYPLKSKGLDVLSKDDLVSLRLPGAGGYGNPLERPLSSIEADLRGGKITREAAIRDYQVRLNEDGWSINREATEKLRKGKGKGKISGKAGGR
jgi:N-methylhydantoinase B